MKERDFLPVFVLENETGELRAIYDLEELRLLVEEFWDILEDDFKFWDADGNPLEFDQSFLSKSDGSIKRIEPNESQIVRSLILQTAKDMPELINEPTDSLSNLYERIVRQKMRGTGQRGP
jgi:hypothetical protein